MCCVILKCCIRLKDLFTSAAVECIIRLIHNIIRLCDTMLSHKVNETITICQRLKRAAIDWTLQKRNNALYLYLWVLSSDVKLKTLPRKTLILAPIGCTLVRKISLTLPTMHIHRRREALLNSTVGANVLASLITLVRESHCTDLG